jgi:hypothetical protein
MTNLPTIITSRDKLTMSLCTCIFGFWLHTVIKQELSKQAVSTITGLIIMESNSESEVCEIEALKSSTIKPGLLGISEGIQNMLFKLSLEKKFKRSSDSFNLFSSVSIMSRSMVFTNFKESIKACDLDN